MKRKHKKKDGFFRQLESEFRRSKSTLILFVVFRTLVIAAGIRSLFLGNFENAFLCALTLALFLIPAFVSHTFKVELPTLLENIVLIFIFAAEILGELNDYYIKYPLWDTMLHTATGFLAAAMGLSLIDLLNRSEKIKFNLSPFFVALVSFCFSMTIGALWEFLEFGADFLVQTDMQKDTVINTISSVALNPDATNVAVKISGITETAVNGQVLAVNGYLDIGLYDTMKDMFVNFIGAAVFAVIGFFYAKYSGKSRSAGIVDGLRIKRRDAENEENSG
ncbi:MAG: hypothetical protein IJY93_07160 [Clostridia bacterium]|nr:hypothetical protein [Clostridia bacterium]